MVLESEYMSEQYRIYTFGASLVRMQTSTSNHDGDFNGEVSLATGRKRLLVPHSDSAARPGKKVSDASASSGLTQTRIDC